MQTRFGIVVVVVVALIGFMLGQSARTVVTAERGQAATRMASADNGEEKAP